MLYAFLFHSIVNLLIIKYFLGPYILCLHFGIGGCYVEGNYLRNAFRWKDTVGPWEERPGHFNDVWNYWTDDGFGFFEGLQVGFPFI